MRASVAAVLMVAVCVSALGCTPGYRRDGRVTAMTADGEFGRARVQAEQTATSDPRDRSYMLDRMKIVQMALAEGLPDQAEPVADRIYDFLRTQGVNEGNGFGAFVFGEQNARVWKGEPFEQAMALAQIAVLDGMNGDWGNVRASAGSALFQIRDVSRIVARGGSQGSERERLISGLSGVDDRRLLELTTPTPSDFALGYVLKAIATRQLVGAFPGEAEEVARQLALVAPHLGPLIETIQTGAYNTVLVVDYGLGPEKFQTGPDGAIASFRPVTRSGSEMLRVSAGGRDGVFPVVADTNQMAMDLRWNNLEDVRLAKSTIGSGLLLGGLTTAAVSDDRNVQAAGLILAGIGAAMKATSGADTRHVETLPQRTYVALLNLTEPMSTIDLSIEGIPSARMVLAGVPSPPSGTVQVRYARLPTAPARAWAVSGSILYASDETGPPTTDNYPYILGGRCVKTPNEDVLTSYQRSGYLRNFTLNDLVDLYRQEGIRIAGRDAGPIGLHILEGGWSLYSPRAGSAGFARLFGQEHGPYRPRSAQVRQLAEEIARDPNAVAGSTSARR